MRPVSGFDRPALQWTFVTLAVVLIAVAAAASLALWRTRAEIERLHAANLQARADAQALEARAARETAARESLALELARVRGSAAAGATAPPTLTLQPLRTRGPVPPPPTVDAPGVAVVIELRLLLPSGTPAPSNTSYTMTIRDWSAGHTLWMRGGLVATRIEGRTAVTGLITGDVFKAGSYEVLLAAAEGHEVTAYEVTVR